MVKPLYQSYLDFRTELEHIEVLVPEQYKKGVVNRVYPKQCFDKAFDYVKKNEELPNIKYVEGLYLNFYADHAWVEIDSNIVFDGTMQRFYDKESYYKERMAIKLVEFTPKEMWEYLYQEQMGNGKPEFWEAKDNFFRKTIPVGKWV